MCHVQTLPQENLVVLHWSVGVVLIQATRIWFSYSYMKGHFKKKPFPRRRMESNKQYHRSKKNLADRGGKICATTVHPTNAMICFRKNRLFKQADSAPKGRILQLSTLDSRLSCTSSTSVKLSFFALRFPAQCGLASFWWQFHSLMLAWIFGWEDLLQQLLLYKRLLPQLQDQLFPPSPASWHPKRALAILFLWLG